MAQPACHTVADLRLAARRRLPRMIFDFFDGGAESEATLRWNEAAFDDWVFRPHFLDGTRLRQQQVELFGHRLDQPVGLGPAGLAGLAWPRGELALARAAAGANVAMILSHASTRSLEEVAAAGPAAPGGGGLQLYQLFLYRDRGVTRAFVERAEAAGYGGIVVTIDNNVLGNRLRDLRHGFTVPPRVLTPRNLLDVACHPRWLFRLGRAANVAPVNYAGSAAAAGDARPLAQYMAELLDTTVGWDDVAWLRAIVKGPLVIKSILHPDEARRAVEAGADGIVVSNHGGRQLDGAPASLAALPAVVEAVGDRVPVLLDGGVRRGADVVKALALGARLCLVARPWLWGLSLAGEAGVARMLEILRGETDRVMALCGVDDVAAIDRRLVERRDGAVRG